MTGKKEKRTTTAAKMQDGQSLPSLELKPSARTCCPPVIPAIYFPPRDSRTLGIMKTRHGPEEKGTQREREGKRKGDGPTPSLQRTWVFIYRT
jgi:hypothetical protein